MKTVRYGSRRDFLRQSFAGAALLCASGGAGALAGAEPVAARPGAAGAKARVVVARDEMLRGADLKVDSGRMLALLDRAMQTLAGHDHSAEAWKALIRPGETVSLKVNTLGGRGISTNILLVAAICERLQQAGVRASDIDRKSVV